MCNYYTNLLTKPHVQQPLFLCILQTREGNYSSAMRKGFQTSFTVQVSLETPRILFITVVPEH